MTPFLLCATASLHCLRRHASVLSRHKGPSGVGITVPCDRAYSVVVRAPYGDIVATPESRETVRQLVNECVAVARAGGVALPDIDFVEMVLRFAEQFGQVFSSTAQDLDRGKRTEVDALNGFVVRRGAESGVATPANQSLLALVKLREARLAHAVTSLG